MSYFLADDNLGSHPKVLQLFASADGLAALGFWTLCGTWSRRYKTHGFVSYASADASARCADLSAVGSDMSATGTDMSRTERGHEGPSAHLANLLCEAGLWMRVEGGYQFHDWAERYQAADMAAERRKRDRERKREARAAAKRERPANDNENVRGLSADKARTKPRTPGSSPTPTPQVKTTRSPPSSPPPVPEASADKSAPSADMPERGMHGTAGFLLEWQTALGAAAFERKTAPPTCAREYEVKVAEQIRKLGTAHGETFAAMCKKVAEAVLTSEKTYPWSVLSQDPLRPAGRRRGAGTGGFGPVSARSEAFDGASTFGSQVSESAPQGRSQSGG